MKKRTEVWHIRLPVFFYTKYSNSDSVAPLKYPYLLQKPVMADIIHVSMTSQ